MTTSARHIARTIACLTAGLVALGLVLVAAAGCGALMVLLVLRSTLAPIGRRATGRVSLPRPRPVGRPEIAR